MCYIYINIYTVDIVQCINNDIYIYTYNGGGYIQ